jgi:hypothetical protein
MNANRRLFLSDNRKKRKHHRAVEKEARYYASLGKKGLLAEANNLYLENYNLKDSLQQREQEVRDLQFKVRKLEILLESNKADESRLEDMPRQLKIKEIIRTRKKATLAKAILDELLVAEPKLKQQWVKPIKQVSNLLSRLVKFGELMKYRSVGSTGYYYGLPEWFDEAGKIKRQFGI